MTTHKQVNVLLVGQIYFDTILDVDHFPEEDHKLRAKGMEQRLGGNTTNTGTVLAQFPRFKVWCMSAIGAKETSGQLTAQLEERGIKTEYCTHRSKASTPSSYIIQSRATGSRTIVSCSMIQDLTLDDFKRKIEIINTTKTMSLNFEKSVPFNWIHFEGRNVDNAVQQIDWIDAKATKEGWRSKLHISVELEKPDRENIDALMPKGDVVFFSKLFAERRGYKDPKEFLYSVRSKCKPSAILFCTWGADGAVCLSPAGQSLHAPAIQVEVVDPVGAGDTFIAGIIHSLSRNIPLNSSLEFACQLASRKVGQSGYDGLANGMLQSTSFQPRSSISSTSPLISQSSKYK